MSKLSDISSKPIVKEYAQGAAQSASSSVAGFIAPPVSVATSVGRFKIYNEEHRFKIPNTLRALGGAATMLGFSASDGTYNCEPNALDFPVDNLEKLETADLENILQEGADMVAAAASLAHEKKVIDLALGAAGAGTALSIGAGDDIIDQLDKRILSVIKAARYGALMGIGLLFGAGASRVTKNHASVRGRFVSGGASKFATPSLPDIANMLISKPEVQMSLMCFDDAPEGIAEDIEFLMDGDILIFARMATPTRRDPSFMKTFRLRGQWMVPGSYQKEDGRGEVAKFDWSEDVKVTNSAAVDRATVVVA